MSGVKKPYTRGRSHNKSKAKHYLEAGQRGFFCTCNFQEAQCVKEAYNLLNEYAEHLYGSYDETQEPTNSSVVTADVDIGDQLQQELQQMKKVSKLSAAHKRFQAVDTGAANCVFIRTSLPAPEALTNALFADIASTRSSRARFLLRMLPIMTTCRANLADIVDAAGQLFDNHFLKETSTFAIIFNRRLHNSVKREDVIEALAELVTSKNINNKADLKNPQKAIIVEVIKGICLLSVVENFFQYKKYNMFEMCKKEEGKIPGETEKVTSSDGEKQDQHTADTEETCNYDGDESVVEVNCAEIEKPTDEKVTNGKDCTKESGERSSEPTDKTVTGTG